MAEQLVKEPYYYLAINGKEIDAFRNSMIDSITYEDNATGSDLLQIVMQDPDLIMLSDSIFVENCRVFFIGGWYKGSTFTFEGFISQVDVDFPDSGTPQLTINCMDNSYIMNLEKKQRSWNNVKASDIARQIFREYGLRAVVDDTGTAEENTSQDDTDIKFLISLAEDQYDTYLCYVEGRTGYFIKKPNLSPPQATLSYRQGEGNMLSFSPSISKQEKQIKITHSEVNLASNKVDTGTANNSTPRNVSGTPVRNNTNTNTSNNSGGGYKYNPSTGKWTKV